MWLPWQGAFWLAVGLAGVATAMRVRVPPRRWLWVRDLAQESAIFSIFYAMWQFVGRFSTGDASIAVSRGRAIARSEHSVHLPSEVTVQHLVLHSHLIIKAANEYYVVGHTTALGVFLVWLYVRHRPDFARWRTVLAFGTIVGELIQLFPVAPPRLTLSSIVDTLQLYGPQVYANDDTGGFAPQLAAMPSLHCVWAITTGAAVFCVMKSRWRWIGPAHAVTTVLVVVVTGNHYWLDALAAALLVLLGLAVADTCAYLWRRSRAETAEDPAASPVEPEGLGKVLR